MWRLLRRHHVWMSPDSYRRKTHEGIYFQLQPQYSVPRSFCQWWRLFFALIFRSTHSLLIPNRVTPPSFSTVHCVLRYFNHHMKRPYFRPDTLILKDSAELCWCDVRVDRSLRTAMTSLWAASFTWAWLTRSCTSIWNVAAAAGSGPSTVTTACIDTMKTTAGIRLNSPLRIFLVKCCIRSALMPGAYIFCVCLSTISTLIILSRETLVLLWKIPTSTAHIVVSSSLLGTWNLRYIIWISVNGGEIGCVCLSWKIQCGSVAFISHVLLPHTAGSWEMDVLTNRQTVWYVLWCVVVAAARTSTLRRPARRTVAGTRAAAIASVAMSWRVWKASSLMTILAGTLIYTSSTNSVTLLEAFFVR